MLDYGYPQNSDITLMKSLIRLGKATEEQTEDESTITSQITGAIDWRREGITYRKNEMFIDTLESVNLLISNTGAVLRSEVIGKIVMKAYLTGMPECRFGLNDKLLISNEKKAKGVRRGKGTGVEIDDCSFHRCVRLGRFDQDRTITFIPPDGEFELMKYRVTENINLPFRILPVYEEISGTTLKINIKLIGQLQQAGGCAERGAEDPRAAQHRQRDAEGGFRHRHVQLRGPDDRLGAAQADGRHGGDLRG